MATVIRLVESDDESVALRAATTVLDRTGHGKRQALDVSGSVQVTAEQIVMVLTRVLSDVGINPEDPQVRTVVASHLRAMGEQQARLRLVTGGDDAS